MKFTTLSIPDVIQIDLKCYTDERGFFVETYQEEVFSRAGVRAHFVQHNHSLSHRGVLRGLHYQIQQAQGKLMRIVSGETFNVAVDLRRQSSTFGKWVGIRLSAGNKLQLWIPAGFAHGFYALEEPTELLYEVTDFYAPRWERTIIWNDPDLEIQWPLLDGMPPILSPKDAQGKNFRDAEIYEES